MIFKSFEGLVFFFECLQGSHFLFQGLREFRGFFTVLGF